MQKPERPISSDCCGSGCLICVYDIYADRLKAYKKWVACQVESDKQKKKPVKSIVNITPKK